MACLKLIWRELGRLGLDEYDDLPTYQRRLLSDLEDGLDDQALEQMFEYWEYNVPRLLDRGRGWRKDVPAKPRIDIHVELSSHGNLKAEWFPRGIGRWGWEDRKNCDFLRWRVDGHRSGGWDSRPSNELLFIHGVDRALATLDETRGYRNPTRDLDHILLQACEKLVSSIESKLDHHFEVRMRQAIFVEYVEKRDDHDWRGDPDKIASWVVEEPERRKSREELAELEDIESRLGFSEQRFVELWEIASKRKLPGQLHRRRASQPRWPRLSAKRGSM